MPDKEKKRTSFRRKENSYFIVLLKKNDLLFASWKIDNSRWKKKIDTADTDSSHRQYLFIEVFTHENGNYKKIDDIPVHGLENNWHIFLKKEYFGKRIVLNLSYRDKKGKSYNILNSEEIDIPLSLEELGTIQPDEEKLLFELAGIDLKSITGSENTSW
jgi:hypothetical protein